ncbi:SecA DEAD-like domain protein, partial [Ancylostoma ceylanicum]
MLSSLLKKIIGDKSVKDRKEYQPYIDKARSFQEQFKSLSDDELRTKTTEFQKAGKVENKDLSINDKEALYDKIDSMTKVIDEKIEETLKEILPEAFAVVVETARRWSENGQLVVKAQDFDRDLAVKKDGITIDGDTAIWHNKWTAAGAEVTWNMVHYDVQLMGGSVLHTGKIAEMQTGEGKTLVSNASRISECDFQ